MKIEIVKSPSALSREEKRDLGKKCHPLAVNAFGTAITEEDVYHHITEVDLLALIYDENGLIAFGSFASLEVQKLRILFVHGVCIAPEKQGKNFFGKILDFVISGSNFDLISARTQNPRLYRAVEKRSPSGIVHPSYQYETPCGIMKIGDSLIKELSLGIEKYKGNLLFKDVYPECLYTVIPQAKEERINFLFREKLEIKEGRSKDALLLFAWLR